MLELAFLVGFTVCCCIILLFHLKVLLHMSTLVLPDFSLYHLCGSQIHSKDASVATERRLRGAMALIKLRLAVTVPMPLTCRLG